jgi:hypothetical protein
MTANYVLLEKVTLGAGAASVTFSNIPQSGYTDLKFVTSARSDAAVLATGGLVNFNGVTTGFTTRYIYGTGSSVVSTTGNREFGSMPGSPATANTFSNSEVIIPNYLSSNYKSYSVDTVTENNATTIYAYLFAGLWSNTAAINSITYAPAVGNFIAGSTFYLYGLAAVGTTPEIAPFASGGNIVTNDGTYWIHTFLSSGTFTPAKALTCDYLVVAGGGGGGGWQGGGGGAGGLRSTVTGTGGSGSLESPLSVIANTGLTVTIGAGGTAGLYAAPSLGTNGTNSVFSSITSTGGGAGGGYTAVYAVTNGSDGGSGGGAGGALATTVGGSASPSGQGFAGGNGATSSYATGGGGGASTVGGNANGGNGSNTGNGGNGGAGRAVSISSSSVTYAGGGGGHGATVGGTGGSGGGGAGPTSVGNGGAGTANRGGGGGGGRDGAGGAGGSGIVIIRYAMA